MRITLLGPAAPSPGLRFPFYAYRIPAGFPSPAQDHLEDPISLDELLELRAPHTFLARADGNSMEGVGIYDQDLLVIDRSLMPEPGQVVIAVLNNEPLVKIFDRQHDQVLLRSANPRFAPRYLLEGEELNIWGVVSYSIRHHGHY